MKISENIETIKMNVQRAAEKVNKTIDDITIIAVTKTVDSDRAIEAIDSGLYNLGENRVQEFNNKYSVIKDKDVKWHIIGHLQTNKVKYVVGKVELIHSLESIPLAEEINKRAKQQGIIANVLIELNLGGEESKFGLDENSVFEFAKSIEQYDHIRVMGMMTVAPYDENPENIRWVFKKMKSIFDEISNLNLINFEMKYLSMGMTNDYEIAIEEGSNMIRVGTAIFGSRNYN